MEELPARKHLSNEEAACERLIRQFVVLMGDTLYIRLPFNEQKRMLGDSYNMALGRFYSLEQKLAKDRVLK